MTLVEVAIAVALLGLVAATGSATLMVLNKNAVSTRVMSGAREIVQRNIEAAMGVPFSTTVQPAILATTGAGGVPWDDVGGTSAVSIYASRDGTTSISGILTRTVTTEANPVYNADLRRITFRIDYSLFGRLMNYQMTTIRALDK